MLTDDSAPTAKGGDSGDDNMVAAAHIAARARADRLPRYRKCGHAGYGGPAGGPYCRIERQIRPTILAAISLALLDPGTARTTLNQIEARLGSGPFNPAKLSGRPRPLVLGLGSGRHQEGGDSLRS